MFISPCGNLPPVEWLVNVQTCLMFFGDYFLFSSWLGWPRTWSMRIETLFSVQTCLMFLGDISFFLFAGIATFHDVNAKWNVIFLSLRSIFWANHVRQDYMPTAVGSSRIARTASCASAQPRRTLKLMEYVLNWVPRRSNKLCSAHVERLSLLALMRNFFRNCWEADRQDNFTVLYHRGWRQLSSDLLRNGDQS